MTVRPAQVRRRFAADRLATLLDALGGIPVSDSERASLVWLAGFEAATVENIAGLIRRARARSRVLAVRGEPETERQSDAVDEASLGTTRPAASAGGAGAAPSAKPQNSGC